MTSLIRRRFLFFPADSLSKGQSLKGDRRTRKNQTHLKIFPRPQIVFFPTQSFFRRQMIHVGFNACTFFPERFVCFQRFSDVSFFSVECTRRFHVLPEEGKGPTAIWTFIKLLGLCELFWRVTLLDAICSGLQITHTRRFRVSQTFLPVSWSSGTIWMRLCEKVYLCFFTVDFFRVWINIDVYFVKCCVKSEFEIVIFLVYDFRCEIKLFE